MFQAFNIRHSLQNLSVLKHFQGEEQKLWAKKWIEKGLIALENVLEGSSGKYCVGDEVTLADCCLGNRMKPIFFLFFLLIPISI